MNSEVGLTIQCVGIVLITLLSFFLLQSIKSTALHYWTAAWGSLSLSLLSLLVGFNVAALQKPCYTLYFLGEYVFGYLFIAGCRNHATGARLTARHLSALIPGVAVAVCLPHVSAEFSDLFILQALIMAALFATAVYALQPARRRDQESPGLRVMSVALLLLTIDFLHYVPVFSGRTGIFSFALAAGYLKYTSIFDLVLEILLGFGTVMVVMEGVRREIEATNRELTEARDKLELLARVDPLTEALNRHAFYSLFNNSRDDVATAVSGCVVMIDIDDLKPINDLLGHAVGDRVIRAVAYAVRSLIRADDMLFRWGGDEFFVLMFSISEGEAGKRMGSLNEVLAQTEMQELSAPLIIRVSSGTACFAVMDQLEGAIEQADRAMFEGKKLHKAQKEQSQTS